MNHPIRRTTVAVALLALIPFSLLDRSHAFDSAPLHAIYSQVYHLTVSGKIRFSGPLDALPEIRVQVTPQDGKAVEAMAQAGTDGRFNLTLSFEGYPNENLDWTMSAQSDRFNPVMIEGRQILPQQTTLALQKSIELTEDKYLLASR